MKIKFIKNNTNNNKRFLIRFVTSYSILLIIVLIMGMFLYQYGITDATNNLHKQNKAVLDNSVSDMDESLKLIQSLSTQIANDSNIRKVLQYDSKSMDFYHDAKEAMNFLTDFIPLENALPIDENCGYYIYLPKLDYLMSSSMLTDTWYYYKHYKAYNDNETIYDDWKTMLSSYNNFFQLLSNESYKENGFTPYIYKTPVQTALSTNKPLGIICFEINRNKLNNIFSNLDFFRSGFLYVTDTDNNEVFRITSDHSPELTEDLLNNIITSMQENPNQEYKELKLEKDTVVVTTSVSQVNQWRYYLVQPADLVFHDLGTYQNTYILIIILTLLFCLIMIFILSKKNIKPIIAIDTELQDSLKEKKNLKQELEEQRPIIYNSYMARIMKGLISNQEEYNKISEFLDLKIGDFRYSVLYACIYQDQLEIYVEDQTNNADAEWNQKQYKDLIRTYFYKYFGDDILIYESEVNAFAIMLPSPMDEPIEESIANVESSFIELHNSLMKEHSIWIYGGLGNRNSYAPYLWKSYQQAIQAASYVREGNVFQSYRDIKRDKTSYYYPFEMAQQLSNFITTGNTKQVQEIFHLIRWENFECRSLPITVVKWLLSDIRNTLLKVRFQVSVSDENREVIESIESSFQDNKTISVLEDIALNLCSLFEPKADGNKLIHTIKAYIKENYKDSSLSLKKISDEFDISESYFSYLFKAETKQNFSEYLELIRMTQAMNLLKTTDINVSDLYLETGYNNANSFRRAFKKVHGVAPKTIRDSMSDHNNE
ncbi:AraC family transcriptional regulator [Lachnoclostridium sp.]|nr:AraC family transcriptional regulator [Lachnoclostridium sp.]